MSQTHDYKSIITEYYTSLDEGEVDKIMKVFSSDAVYKRCEDIFLGKPEIVEFFTKKLSFKGKHQILKMNSDEKTVIVRGIFDGTNGDGETVREFFSDFFTFNDEDLVYTRETYIAKGAKDIQ